MFGYVVLAITAFLFIFVPQATFIIFGGLLICLALLGVSAQLKKRIPGSKKLMLFVTMISWVLLILGASWFAGSRIAGEMEFFSEQFPKAMDEVVTTLKETSWYNKLLQEADEGNWIENFIAPKVLPKTAKMATVTLNGLTAFGIALLLGVYFAVDSARYSKLLVKLVPRKQEQKFKSYFTSMHDNLQGWLLGKILSMIAVGILSYIGLVALGIKAAFPLAFIAGFLGFIPNVGPILSAIPAIIIAFAKGWEIAVYVAILYMAIQAMEGMLITPLIQRKTVRLLPAGLITFQFIMAVLFGFAGLFLATPILVAVSTTIDEFWINNPNR